MPRDRQPPSGLVSAATLCVVVLIGFGPALRGGFVYDDSWTIVNNSTIRSFDALPDLLDGTAVAQRRPDAWRPLMVLSHMVDYRLFGLRPFGYHLHSLLWHLVCVLLLWLLVRRLLRSEALALLGASLFALHPLQVEPVAAVSYREDLLATCFVLAALLLMLPPRRRPGPDAPTTELLPGGLRALLAGCALLLGLAAKGSAAVALPLQPLLALTAVDRSPAARRRHALAGVVALGVALGLFLLWRVATSGALDPYPQAGSRLALPGASWAQRALPQGEALLRTAGRMLWPVGLSPEYPPPGSLPLQLGGLLLLVALLALLVRSLRRGHSATAGGLGLLTLGWLPYAGLLPLPNLQADRYTYLAVAGFSVLLAAQVLRIRRDELRHAVVFVLVLGYGLLGYAQQAVWHDELALWRRAVQRAPGSCRAATGLARALGRRGSLQQAETTARHALSLAGCDGLPQLVLANILTRKGLPRLALPHYRLADQRGVRHPAQLYTSWGWALHLLGDNTAAVERLRRAVAQDPHLEQARRNLRRVLGHTGPGHRDTPARPVLEGPPAP